MARHRYYVGRICLRCGELKHEEEFASPTNGTICKSCKEGATQIRNKTALQHQKEAAAIYSKNTNRFCSQCGAVYPMRQICGYNVAEYYFNCPSCVDELGRTKDERLLAFKDVEFRNRMNNILHQLRRSKEVHHDDILAAYVWVSKSNELKKYWANEWRSIQQWAIKHGYRTEPAEPRL